MISKYKLLIVLFINACLGQLHYPARAQTASIIDLVKQGVAYHDKGEFIKAISFYQKALELDSNSTLVNYEMAYSYFELKKYDSAKAHCLKAMVEGAKEYVPAVLVYGSILDNTGNPDQAVKLYKKTLKKYPDNYRLHYNLAISYSRIPLPSKAEKQLELAIRNNLGHGSSHLALGEMMYNKNNVVESLLPLYFFLVIEPDTERSTHALNLIFDQLAGKGEKTVNDSYKLSLSSANAYDQQFGTENLIISMNAALKEGEDEFDWFHNITKILFQSLAENYMLSPGIWRDVYVPAFADLVQSAHFDTFCYYISQKRYQKSETWMYAHPKEIDEMFAFLNN